MRPGRFDRKIMVARPDVRGREDAPKSMPVKKISEDVNLKHITEQQPGLPERTLQIF